MKTTIASSLFALAFAAPNSYRANFGFVQGGPTPIKAKAQAEDLEAQAEVKSTTEQVFKASEEVFRSVGAACEII